MALLSITNSIAVFDDELHESFVRASGPGGQNVNKVSSAVQLRFDVRQSPNLPERVREKILSSGDSRLTKDGVLVILADRHRTQEMNRKDARDRLFEVIRKAAHVPKRRVPTKPTLRSKRRRIESKVKRGAVKKGRSGKISLD
ncbi:MAG: alternative ribosome rescue aminoacyl-tRNA hydrolase ArfB [Hyphomicrobiales bacterium]